MITDQKAKKIAEAYIENGNNATAALRSNGYTDNGYLHTVASRVLRNSTKIQRFLDQLYDKSDKYFSNVDSIANLSIEKTVIDKQGKEHTVIDSKLAGVKLTANKDLLDRLGHGAIKKSMNVNKKVDDKELTSLKAEIADLEAQLKEKEQSLHNTPTTHTQPRGGV